MDFPYFSLQSPVTDFQIEIYSFIKVFNEKNYPNKNFIRIFGVPISQVIHKKKEELKCKNQQMGLYYGKLPILIIKAICNLRLEI